MNKTGAESGAKRCRTRYASIGDASHPFELQDGGRLGRATLAFETYGKLSPACDNVILLFHALTGSQHAAGMDRIGPADTPWTEDCHVGWWNDCIGPGHALDTRKYYVICANYLGGCYGSTGPASLDDAAGRPYGQSFPNITVGDIVASQVRLLDLLGIQRLAAAIGASFAGYLVLDLALRWPDRVAAIVSIASGIRATPQHRVANLQQKVCIESDPLFGTPAWNGSNAPRTGLMLARLRALEQYVNLNSLAHEFHDNRTQMDAFFLRHAARFVKRFDAHTYHRLIGAWQSYDPGFSEVNGATKALARCRDQRWLVMTFTGDTCFPQEEQYLLADCLSGAVVPHRVIEVQSAHGHDAFLREPASFAPALESVLETRPYPRS